MLHHNYCYEPPDKILNYGDLSGSHRGDGNDDVVVHI